MYMYMYTCRTIMSKSHNEQTLFFYIVTSTESKNYLSTGSFAFTLYMYGSLY